MKYESDGLSNLTIPNSLLSYDNYIDNQYISGVFEKFKSIDYEIIYDEESNKLEYDYKGL